MYIAHHPITLGFRNVTYLIKPIGLFGNFQEYDGKSIRPAGILELHSTDVSSIRVLDRGELDGIEYANLVASGKFTPEN
jgi:hypothetical protein